MVLEGIGGREHQHGVGHHRPPEHLEQLTPQTAVDLEEGEAEQQEEHLNSLVENEAASEADQKGHVSTHTDLVPGVGTCDWLP